MSEALQQLYETYQIVLSKNGPHKPTPTSDHLHFPSALSLFLARNYTQMLASTNLPKTLSFFLATPLDCDDLDYFLSRCTSFIYGSDWPTDLSGWLIQAIDDGRSYQVTYLKMNNLRLILSQEDLLRLKQVFPSLTRLEYIHQGSPEYDQAPLTKEDLQAVFSSSVLDGFDL
jgi:hypothetical protein